MSYIEARRQEERDRRRTEIVDAADAVYAESGWDSVTMDQVARRARLSRALVYVYFKDKSDLHLALVERSLDVLRDRFEAARRDRANGFEQLVAIGRAYMDYSRATPHYYDACARYQAHACDPASPGHDLPPNEAACIDAGRRVQSLIVQSIEQGVADGSVRPDIGDPDTTAIVLWAYTHGLIQVLATKGGQIEHDGIAIEAVIERAFSLVRRALAT